jgi:hypothetical protein
MHAERESLIRERKRERGGVREKERELREKGGVRERKREKIDKKRKKRARERESINSLNS